MVTRHMMRVTIRAKYRLEEFAFDVFKSCLEKSRERTIKLATGAGKDGLEAIRPSQLNLRLW